MDSLVSSKKLLLAGLAATLVSGAPDARAFDVPVPSDPANVSVDVQRDYEAAAVLLNLRALKILEPNGPICAEITHDPNGRPKFSFSVQGDDAFETGSCTFNSQKFNAETLRKLAKFAQTYYSGVQGKAGSLPILVDGYADGQRFDVLGNDAKLACPDLGSAKKENGSYNRPLARSRASRVGDELASVFPKDSIVVAGHDSPKLVGKPNAACETRRQVVISLDASPTLSTDSVRGQFEPASGVSHEVQLAMNAAVAVPILQAHARAKAKMTAACPSGSASSCMWKYLQSVVDELGIAPGDTACRAPTLALVNDIIGRADPAFVTKVYDRKDVPNSAFGDQMLKLASDPSAAASAVGEFIGKYQRAEKTDLSALTKCESSAVLHLTNPTPDLFNDNGKEYCRSMPAMRSERNAVPSSGRVTVLLGLLSERRRTAAYAGDPRQKDAAQKQIAEYEAELGDLLPGIKSYSDFSAYQAAGLHGGGRRNLAYNCVKPDLKILATGYAAAKDPSAHFIDPTTLGTGSVDFQYTSNTFGTEYYHDPNDPHDRRFGFGCEVCGSGISLEKGRLSFRNQIVDQKNDIAPLDGVFGKDGLEVIRRKDITAASGLAPALYEIPNCAHCSCIGNDLEGAIRRAYANPPIVRSVDMDPKAGKAVGTRTLASLSDSCVFNPAVDEACPVGPNGHSEQGMKGARLERSLTLIDQGFKQATVQVGANLPDILQKALTAPCNCTEAKPRELPYYQSLVDEVVCSTRKPPIRLPTPYPGSEAKDCAGAAK